MSLTINATSNKDSYVVDVTGEVDVSNASQLREALDAGIAAKAPTVEVDMSAVPYIDSTGIGVLVGAAHHAQDAGSQLVVVHPQRNVSRVLDLLGVGKDLNVREA